MQVVGRLSDASRGSASAPTVVLWVLHWVCWRPMRSNSRSLWASGRSVLLGSLPQPSTKPRHALPGARAGPHSCLSLLVPAAEVGSSAAAFRAVSPAPLAGRPPLALLLYWIRRTPVVHLRYSASRVPLEYPSQRPSELQADSQGRAKLGIAGADPAVGCGDGGVHGRVGAFVSGWSVLKKKRLEHPDSNVAVLVWYLHISNAVPLAALQH